jgi:hypothetical protein
MKCVTRWHEVTRHGLEVHNKSLLPSEMCNTAFCKWVIAVQIVPGVEHKSPCSLMFVDNCHSMGKCEGDAHNYHSMYQAIT